jgi:hypothetical protein
VGAHPPEYNRTRVRRKKNLTSPQTSYPSAVTRLIATHTRDQVHPTGVSHQGIRMSGHPLAGWALAYPLRWVPVNGEKEKIMEEREWKATRQGRGGNQAVDRRYVCPNPPTLVALVVGPSVPTPCVVVPITQVGW